MSAFLAFRTAAVHAVKTRSTVRCAVLASPHRRPVLNFEIPATGSNNTRTMSSAARSHPKNRQIPYPVVQLRDSETGRLHAPTKLDTLLSTIDVQTHLVRLVTHQPPIVRILSIAEDKKEKLERKLLKGGRVGGSGMAGGEGVSSKPGLARGEEHGGVEGQHVIPPVIQNLKSTSGGAPPNKAGRVTSKSFQLNWTSSPADVAMKLSKIRDELERGGTSTRVDISWLNKRGQKYPPPEEMKAMVDNAIKEIGSVGAEYKERDYARRGSVKVFLQGTTKKVQGVVTEDMLAELAREEARRFERQAARLREKKEHEKAEKESWEKQFGGVV